MEADGEHTSRAAIAVVTDRYDLDGEAAARLLTRLSGRWRVEVVVVATELVAAAEDRRHRVTISPPPRPPTDDGGSDPAAADQSARKSEVARDRATCRATSS